MDRTRYLPLFLEEARSHVEGALALLGAAPARCPDGETVKAIARHLHSLKGIASCMGREPIARIAHECEDLLARWARGGVPRARAAVRSALERCERMLARLERGHSLGERAVAPAVSGVPWHLELELFPGTEPLPLLAALGSEIGPIRCCRPERAALRRGVRPRRLSVVLRSVLTARQLAASVARLPGVERFYLEPARLAFRDLVRPLVVAGAALADALGKRVRFEVGGTDVELDRSGAAAFLEALVHVLRNAVDHGIESPEERRAGGKHAVGVVRVRVETNKRNHLRVRVEDDGRGFHPGAAGRPAPLARTAPAASGRGIGLVAASRALEPVGGTLRLRGRPGRGTLVELVLPRGASRSGGGCAPSGARRWPARRRGRP